MRRARTHRATTALLLGALLIAWTHASLADSEPGAGADAPPAVPREAVDVVFVLDNSGSMKENDPDYLARSAVADFAAALADTPSIDGRVGIVLFDGRARLVRPLSPLDRAADDTGLAEALGALDFSGQRTDSPAGIERALYEFRQNGREDARRAIVFLTDGHIDTGDGDTDVEAARWLREDLAGESATRGIRIFGVAFTDAADYQLIQALARRTEASYYRAFDPADLQGVVDDVLQRIVAEKPESLAASETARSTSERPEPPEGVDVAAARATTAEDSGLPLSALLPVAVLLVAGGFVWSAIRRRHTRGRGRADTGPPVDAPPAQLLDLDGRLGRPGAAVELARARTRIGRDPHNELAFDGVDSISAEHAVIEYRDGHYWIEDLRSTNGTRLDGEPLVPGRPAQLKGGDRIRLADIELMFVLAGYAPRGETVFLDPTTTPPDAPTRAIDDGGIDVPREGLDAAAAGAEAERSEPARSSQLSLLQGEDAAMSADDPAPGTSAGEDALARAVDRDDAAGEPSATASGAAGEDPAEAGREATHDACHAIRANLDDHLRRVQALSEAFATFVARAFEGEIRDAIAVSARDLVAEARDRGRVARKHYTFDHVRFVLCGVPGGVEQARQLFVDAFGGFTRLLSEELHADTFRAERCEVLAVLTFGDGEAPWVSLSIVPDEEHDPRIDLLSYELLTEEELREIDLDGPTDLSQSGLG